MRTTLSRLSLAAILFSTPFSAVAAGSVLVADSIAGLGATVHLADFPASSSLTLSVATPEGRIDVPAQTDMKGEGSALLKASQTEAAGIYTISVKQGTQTLSSGTQFEVLPDTVDTAASEMRAVRKSIDTDGQDQATVVVTLRDKFGNPLPGRPVTLVSNRTSDGIETDGMETDENGEQRFYVSTRQSGVITLRALDLLSGGVLQSTVSVTAGGPAVGGNQYVSSTRAGNPFAAQLEGFDVIDRFEITAPRTMVVGEEAPKISIRAVDTDGNTVQDYLGTVRFDAPNDPDAVLPGLGRYTFKDANLGQKEFPITLKFSAPGEQILRVEDEQDSTIYGEITITVSGGNGQQQETQKIEITNYKDGDTVSTLNIKLEGTGPRLSNLIVTGALGETTGDTDASGNFEIPVVLDGDKPVATLRVRDESGRYTSDSITLTIDRTGPEIKSVLLAPNDPVTNDKVLVTVESEPKLPKVTARLQGFPEVQLVEGETTPGTYQGFLTAPAEPGTYQPVITAEDAAGNSSETRAQFEARKPGLPKVKNLRGEPKINSVSLEWDSVEGGVGEYRVYVGDSPTNFLYNLDTGRDVNRATVAGLSAGKVYYFAVTALKEGEESQEKSDVLEARVLGLTLEVTPQDSSLVVKWPELATQLPLSSYILEYGVEDGNYSEKRLINGELKTYTIRDLLNGVTYFIQLTPVTITGDRLSDLAAKGQGTPNGSGFSAGPGDPIPFDPDNLPPISNTTTKPDLLDDTGVPGFIWWLTTALALAAGGAGWYHRQSRRHSAAFLRAIQAKYH